MNAAFSATALRHLRDVISGYVERSEVPGLVTLVSRRGETNVDALGKRSTGAGSQSVRRDTIFRIASMTKPITAVATMILVEESKLHLDEPVDRLLPELANRNVLKRVDGPLDDTVPARRSITVRDLLTFQLGLGFLLAPPDTHPIVKAMYERGVGVTPFPAEMPHSPDEWIRHLGTLPLIYQPGESWLYHTGSDALGVLIARAAGRPLETFFRERIFEPLGMKDTSFYVPSDKLDRFVSCYSFNPRTKKLDLIDPPNGQWSHRPAFPACGSGLVSTVDDYLAFARMMLNKGTYGPKRLVSASSIEMMTTNKLPPDQQQKGRLILGENMGWGFGVSVLTKPDGLAKRAGRYGWNGGLGSSWWNDPNEGLIAIILTERRYESPDPPPVIKDFWKSAYESIRAET
ncbi:MAG TPA: serine hydrolase domain-containing protein [Candidatus Acidoferrales bacterium]|nr:serine hydrolase domain-containing protein [Candidatus Acidoferrales bacterium]